MLLKKLLIQFFKKIQIYLFYIIKLTSLERSLIRKADLSQASSNPP